MGELNYTQTLRGGGSITLTFDLDWLSASVDDLMFVRSLYDTFRAYPGASSSQATDVIEPAARPAVGRTDKVKCDECGGMFNVQGIGPHRRKHARKAAPAPAMPSKWDGPKAQRPIVPDLPADKVYRCECREEFTTENDLAKHTMSRHGRPPRSSEQAKVAAA